LENTSFSFFLPQPVTTLAIGTNQRAVIIVFNFFYVKLNPS